MFSELPIYGLFLPLFITYGITTLLEKIFFLSFKSKAKESAAIKTPIYEKIIIAPNKQNKYNDIFLNFFSLILNIIFTYFLSFY